MTVAASSPEKLMSVFGCFSRFGEGNLPCDFNSLKGPRKAVYFRFVQLFSSCNDCSDDFQGLYMSELKRTFNTFLLQSVTF